MKPEAVQQLDPTSRYTRAVLLEPAFVPGRQSQRIASSSSANVLPNPSIARALAGPKPSLVDPQAPRTAPAGAHSHPQARPYDLRDVTPEGLQRALRTLRSQPALELDADVVDGLAKLSAREKRMVVATLNRIAAVKAGTLNSADYMFAVMRDAAAIAGDDGILFSDLVCFAFNTRPTVWFEKPRRWLGAGYHPVGSVLERTFGILTEKPGGQDGYNPNIKDTIDPDSTMTHHFGELLMVGAHRWRWLGMAAQRYIDSPTGNPGDVRSGYLAVNLGRGLAKGKITPDDAIRIAEWGFVLSEGPPPPWGLKDTGTYLSWGDYHLRDWVEAFNRAHPEAPVALER